MALLLTIIIVIVITTTITIIDIISSCLLQGELCCDEIYIFV
jgi:hypothetical protein